ncbi:Trp biosynthesis-associated membrane protein [Microbacterium sp.]|uniref:Trp biosynthesis-associated membrane protein n=1 Tax=Microbacterium sp. TaxID=51671 RepID=UPI0039E4493E
MTHRPRTLAVLAIVLGGAIGVLSSTQPWLEVTLAGGGPSSLSVAGASAVAVLAPLSLAALALGLALSIVGVALRYGFAVLALVLGGAIAVMSWRIATQRPLDAVAASVTEATGLSGTAAVADLVEQVAGTAWPWLAVVAGAAIVAGGVIALATARSWRSGASRYRTGRDAPGPAAARPHDAARSDAIDSWDDLSRGDDPTA